MPRPSDALRAGMIPPADTERTELHARRQRLKRLLRYLPRRAVLHRYPLVGRFAATARRRSYLWSLRDRNVRAGIYLGAIVSLWPVMGMQIGVVFVASLLFRANVMVAGALQLLSNPFTAAPLYYSTYRVGRFVLDHFGYRTANDRAMPEAMPDGTLPVEMDTVTRFQDAVTALFVGGTVCGLVLALVLDVVYLATVRYSRPRIASAAEPGGNA